MSDEGAYFNYGLMKGLNRELGPAVQREMKIVTDQWKAHADKLEQTNQQNLYFLGSALGAASEERMSRYTLLAYIGSIFAVLNKKLGKEAVRQMLSLDTPEMERVLTEKLAEFDGKIKTRPVLDFIEIKTEGVLKNEHIRRGYEKTVNSYAEVYGKSISSLHTQDIGHEMRREGVKLMLDHVQESRMPS